ncbi:hypothetical protein phiAS5_ORF0036 [Aeromonas phage phiAS5]|uniref:Uncharacterized protein n=1 Tax=Aeromonas phage phiAS5 TaxID=879630 RepID=E1A2D3_9CAUD|nr:hypothetical protein phiAS5_ORF0036 [Aeromonas phage phiAS5]ADM79879.1 hypothetical protein phiAS5_ORF0036 [Aeromonas phage phiAS5]BES53015.1 hypothetical protein [Aeromonas phage phiWae14]
MNIKENVVSTLTMFVTIWGAVFAYNSFIGDQRDYKLKEEITAHFDQSVASLKDDISKLPTHSDVENAQLKSMLYAKEVGDAKTIEDRKLLDQMQAKIDDLSRKVEQNQRRPGEVAPITDSWQRTDRQEQ